LVSQAEGRRPERPETIKTGMVIGILKEIEPAEPRCAMVPGNVPRLLRLGAEVRVESGLGHGCHFPDEAFALAGATIARERGALLAEADILLRVRKPHASELEAMRPECLYVSFLDPFKSPELLRKLAERGVSAISLEMLPRISRAQKMDALTSQANLAGYVAALLGRNMPARFSP